MNNTNFTMRIFSLMALILLSTLISQGQVWYKANDPFGGNILKMHETGNGDILCGTNRGLFKSTDNGDNWTSISGESANLPVLDVNSNSSGIYFSLFYYSLKRSNDGGQTWELIPAVDWTSLSRIVINDDNMIFLNTNNGVWRSVDGGDNWTQLGIGGNTLAISTLEFSPDGDLYAGTFNKKIYRSADNGDNWVEVFLADNDIRSFAFDGNNTVYASTSFSGLYKSDDNGDNWSNLTPVPGTDGAFNLNTNSAGEIFAAVYDGGVFKSADGGASWQDISYDMIDPEVRYLFVDTADELYAGTSAGGVLWFEGSSWIQKNQGMTAIYIERFITIDGILYACTDKGIFISEDGGQNWQQSLKGMDDTEIVAMAKAPNGDLYAGGEMLYYSEDGINWNNISQGFPGSEVTATDMVIEPDGKIILATDEYGIRISDDQGQTWSYANTGLDDVTMTFIRKSPAGYFFTADGYNLYRSNDLTGAWEIINNGLDDTDIIEFAVGNNTLFAISYSDGLFKSTDNGDNWSLAIDEDFNNIAVNGDEVFGSSGSMVNGGVYFSDDNGTNWTNIVNGLPNVQIEEVTYVEGLGLFANVRDFGLYTLDFSVTDLEDILFNKQQLACYPNPFKTATTIQLELVRYCEVSYTVINLQGQVVQQSGAMKLSKGIQQIKVGENLLPGMYLLTVRAGNTLHSIRLAKNQ